MMSILTIAAFSTLPAVAQPANDECTNPTPITGAGSFTFDMTDATQSAPGFFCNTDFAHDVWFCWTATCDGPVTISTCGTTQLDTVIALYDGCACPTDVQPPVEPICCNDDSPNPGCAPQSEMTCDVVCGQQYMIRIADKEFTGAPGSGGGGFRIVCGTNCPPPPEPSTCDDCCGTAPNYSGFAKVAVMTQQFADGPPGFAGNVLGVVDITNQGTAPVGSNWNAAPFYAATPAQQWTRDDLGSVFGVTIDDEGNIYLAHTSIFRGGAAGIGDAIGNVTNGAPGAIYKVDTNTGVAAWLQSLPNFSDPNVNATYVTPAIPSELFPGLGDITFDCGTQMLYVSNFEDGRVYRMDKAGNIQSTFDHATGSIDTWTGSAPEPGDIPGWAPLGERVWAVKTTANRLYYSVWWEDRGFFGPNGTNRAAPNYANANEIWSIAIDGTTGEFLGVPQLEIQLPGINNIGGEEVSNPVAGLAFTDDCCMIVAERTMNDDTSSFAHQSRLLEYCYDSAAGWSPSADTFGISTSSTGGAAFDFEGPPETQGQIWGMWDGSPTTSYGGIAFPHNAGAVTFNDAVMIDNDQSTDGQDKFEQGDIMVSCASKCATLVDESILCDVDPVTGPTGTYTYEFCLTNNSGVDVHYLLFPTLEPHVVWIAGSGAWLAGETRCFTVTLTGDPGEEICFPLVLADENVQACCRTDLCVLLPNCDCMQFPECEITCVDPTTGTYMVSISVQNLAYAPAGHMFVIPYSPTSGVVVNPDYVPLPLPLWGTSALLNFTVTVPAGLDPFCLLFTIHDETLQECCSVVKCFDLPECPTLDLLCDSNCDGIVSVSDIGAFVLALTNPTGYAASFPGCPLSNSDMNHDGMVTVSDIGAFVESMVN